MNFELLRELAGLPTLKEAAGFRFQPSWCLIDSHTDEVLSSSSDKQKLIVKQNGKYGQTSTEIAWGYADEDGDFVEVDNSQLTVVKEEYHDTSDFDAAIHEVLDHLRAAQKIVDNSAWRQHMVDAVDQGAPESTVATNKTMTMRLGTLIDSYVALYESLDDL